MPSEKPTLSEKEFCEASGTPHLKAQETSRNEQLIDKFTQLEKDASRLRKKAEQAKDWRTALAALKEQI